MRYPHVPFGKVPILKNLYSYDVPTGGNKNTVFLSYYFNSAANVKPGVENNWFPGTHSANLRVVTDLGSSDFWMSLDTGNSETILSPHFFD